MNLHLMMFIQGIIYLKIQDGAYVINLDVYESIGTHQIALYVNANNIVSFNTFVVKHIPKEIGKFIRNINITTNIYRIQAYDSIMCGFFLSWIHLYQVKR